MFHAFSSEVNTRLLFHTQRLALALALALGGVRFWLWENSEYISRKKGKSYREQKRGVEKRELRGARCFGRQEKK
jgi:hypothetical protein